MSNTKRGVSSSQSFGWLWTLFDQPIFPASLLINLPRDVKYFSKNLNILAVTRSSWCCFASPWTNNTLKQIYKLLIHWDIISVFADYFRFLHGPEVFFQTPKEDQGAAINPNSTFCWNTGCPGKDKVEGRMRNMRGKNNNW